MRQNSNPKRHRNAEINMYAAHYEDRRLVTLEVPVDRLRIRTGLVMRRPLPRRWVDLHLDTPAMAGTARAGTSQSVSMLSSSVDTADDVDADDMDDVRDLAW